MSAFLHNIFDKIWIFSINLNCLFWTLTKTDNEEDFLFSSKFNFEFVQDSHRVIGKVITSISSSIA